MPTTRGSAERYPWIPVKNSVGGVPDQLSSRMVTLTQFCVTNWCLILAIFCAGMQTPLTEP